MLYQLYQFTNNNKNRSGTIEKDLEEKDNIESILKDNAAPE